MKKTFLFVALLVATTVAFAQATPEMKLNKETNLIEATYFHEDGTISQQGTFNVDRKLHGEWVSYNADGKTISVGSYNNGVKTGKWMFWANNVLKEVEYSNNAIAGITESANTEGIVSRN